MIKLIAGVDEAGRGPLAGPLITAAVILPYDLTDVKDSKKLTPLKRKSLALKIKEQSICFAYGRAEVAEIEKLNIHNANLLAMHRAVAALPQRPHEVLVDGVFVPPDLKIAARAIINGDSLINVIAAASILAKVLRDEEMIEMDEQYPRYGFAQHKGYATKGHLQALRELGPCPIHRKTFSPIANYLSI